MAVKIVTVGDNCMDVYENIGKAYPGGNPVNVAVYFVRQGGEAGYTGIVGTDDYGKLMVEAIAAKGVDVSRVRAVEGRTAITHVKLIDGDRIMGDYEEGVLADFKLTEEEVEHLGSQKLVVSALWGNSQGYFPAIREKGAKIAYDAATRPDDPAAVEAIPYVNYLFYSGDGGDSCEAREQMKKLHSKGPEIVVMTLGDEGSLAYDGENFYKHGIVSCEVVDTMGAGDSYISGFLKGVLENKTVPECMAMGAECAAVTIGYYGAW